LRHIQRTRVLIHVLDGTSHDVMADYAQINTELALFDPHLEKKAQLVVLNKMDIPEVEEKYPALKKQFDRIKINLLSCSTIQKKNLKEILWEAYHLLQSIPLEEIRTEIPVYRAEMDENAFEVTLSSDGFMIHGASIERAAEMTYWDNFESLRRFQRILQALGITDRLRELEIDEGDIVHIGKYELVWTEQFDDYD
jgi:GTP-binding protein